MAGDSAGGHEVGRISVRVVPNLDHFYDDLKAKLEAAEKELKGEIKVTPDLRDFREKVNAETKGMETKVKVKADLDQTNFEKLLAFTKLQAKAAGVKLKVNFEDKEAEAGLAILIAKLKAEAKLANIKLKVDVDKNQVGSGLAGLFGGGAKAGGSAFGGLGSFADTGALVAAVAAVIAPALALVAGAVAVLPALLAGVLVPIGAVALGFKGIAAAADAAGLLGTDKKGKQGIGPALKALQETLSKKFQDGFTPIFKQLAPLIPALGQGLLPVADGVIKIAQAFTNMVTSPAVLQAIGTTFDNIGRALSVAAPGIAKFSESIIGLIAGGSRSLPAFAGLFGSMGNAIGGWVADVSKQDFWGTSKLDRGIGNFITVLKSAGGLIGSIFKDSFDLMADPKFTKNMTDFLDGLKSFAHDILPGLKDTFSVLADLVKQIGDGMDKIDKFGKDHPGAKGPLDSIGGILHSQPDKSSPAVQTGEGFDFEHSNVKKMIDRLGSTDWLGPIKVVLDTLTTLWSAAWDQMGQGVSNIGNLISQAFDGALATVTGIATNIGSALSGAWSGVVAEAQNAWGQVSGVISGAIGNISGIVSSIGGAISGIWQGVVSEAASAWDSVVSAVQSAISNVIAIVSAVPGQIAGIFASAAGALVAAGEAMMNGLLSGIKAGLQSVLAFASSIAGQIAAVKGPLPKDRTTLTPAGLALMDGLQAGLEGGFQGVLGRAQEMAKQIADAISHGMAGVDTKQLSGELEQQLKEINLESDQLRVQRDQTTDKGQKKSLGDQLQQLGAVRDQLKLQQDQLGFSKKYGEQQDSNNQMQQQFGQMLNKTIGIGKNFADANIKQFVTDIGGSGNGAIPAIAEQGIGWLTQTLGGLVTGAFGGKPGGGGGVNINVNSVDEALAAHTNIVNKQAMQYTDRR